MIVHIIDSTETTTKTSTDSTSSSTTATTSKVSTTDSTVTTTTQSDTSVEPKKAALALSAETDKNIFVDAGYEQHLYYPLRTCVLNGSNTMTLDNSQIVKWEWSKNELSPAVGVSHLLNSQLNYMN